MGLKLIKTESYGIVYGHPIIAFEQNGHQFRPDGTLIDWNSIDKAEEVAIEANLDTAQEAINKARSARSEAIKAGLARKKREAANSLTG